jgi:hypothetical protein
LTQNLIPNSLRSSANPSGLALINWLKTKISRRDLEEIAANDNGEEIPDHLAGIELQLSESLGLGPLPWCPREVLELERWQEPDRSYDGQAPTGRHGHWKRLLACSILLRSAAGIRIPSAVEDAEFFLDPSGMTLLQLTRSAIAVADEGPTLALGFLIWLYEQFSYPSLLPFVAFCAFLLWMESNANDYDCESIGEVIRWVEAEELRCRDMLAPNVTSDRWVVRP